MNIEMPLGKNNLPIGSQTVEKESAPGFRKIPDAMIASEVPKSLHEALKDPRYDDCQFYKFMKKEVTGDIVEYQAVGDIHTDSEQATVLVTQRMFQGKPIGEPEEIKIKPSKDPSLN